MRNIIYYISKRYYKISRCKYKSIQEVRECRLRQNKFLNGIFKEDREQFINTFTNNLQKGRIKYNLECCYDSTNITYQQQAEQYFLYGWWYAEHVLNNGEIYPVLECNNGYTTGCTNKASLQYSKFLTEKYGTKLFINKKEAA